VSRADELVPAAGSGLERAQAGPPSAEDASVTHWKGRARTPYVFVAGAAVYLIFLLAIPMLDGVWLGFTDTNLLNPTGGRFVGVRNYSTLLSNPATIHSLVVTAVYTVAVVAGSMSFGILGALLLNRKFPGRAAVRALLTLPWAMPTVAVALIFNWIYNQQGGVLNRVLVLLHIPHQGWLTEPRLGLLSVTLASIWMVYPFVMLVVLAALQGIPDELYEAARVDGASGSETLRTIILPVLRPTIAVAGLFMTIWSLRRFDLIWLLTQGGPIDATNSLVIDVYRTGFLFNDLGVSAALGVIGLCLSGVVTCVYFIADRRIARDER
jgi:multiple sugar transport system permease protein